MKPKKQFVIQTIFLIRPIFFKNLFISAAFSSLLIAFSVILPLLFGSIKPVLLALLLIFFLVSQAFFNYLQFKKIIRPAISKLYPALAAMLTLSWQDLLKFRLKNFHHFLLLSDWSSTLLEILSKGSKRIQWRIFWQKLISFFLLFIPFALLITLIVKEASCILLLYLLLITLIFINFLYQGFVKLFLLLKTLNELNN